MTLNTDELEETSNDKIKKLSSHEVKDAIQNTQAPSDSRKRVGIIGYGHLGQFLKVELSKSKDFCLKRVWNRTPDKEEDVLPLSDLNSKMLADIDIILEVAHPDIIRDYGELMLQHSDLFIGSPIAFADRSTLKVISDSMQCNPKRSVFVSSGSFWGANDIKRMADFGLLKSLTMTIIKHPDSLSVHGPLTEYCDRAIKQNFPVVVYDGPARMLCSYMEPANLNMIATCAIVAHNLGFDNTRIKIIADPYMLNWSIVEYEAFDQNGSKTIVRRQNPAHFGPTREQSYFSFLSSIKETLYKPPGLNIC